MNQYLSEDHKLENEIHKKRLELEIKKATTYAHKCEFIDNAVVQPLSKFYRAVDGSLKFDGGVFYENKTVCHLSLHKKNGSENIMRDYEEPQDYLRGVHIFGGILKNEHFGHFLVESLARLWVYKNSKSVTKSIVFFVRDKNLKVQNYVYDFFKIIDREIDIKLISKPTRVERLIVPEQIAHETIGFIAGSLQNRDLINKSELIFKHLPKKTYFSRSKLNNNEGSILHEKIIEDNLAKEGYTIVHPQELTMQEQLSILASSEKIIFAEGSPIHLFVLAGNKNQDSFIIRRRPMGIVFDWQINSFGLKKLNGKSHIKQFYIPTVDGTDLSHAIAIIDFESLKNDLIDNKFIDGEDWLGPTDSETNNEIADYGVRINGGITPHSYADFIRRIV